MSITLDFAPYIENRLRELAARRGLTPAGFAKAIVEREALAAEPEQEMTPEEEATAFLAWAAGHRTDTPVILMEALSRESLYEDRGLSAHCNDCRLEVV